MQTSTPDPDKSSYQASNSVPPAVKKRLVKPTIDANHGSLGMLVAIVVSLVFVQLILGVFISYLTLAEGENLSFYWSMFLNFSIQVTFVAVAFLFLRERKLLFPLIPKDFKSTSINCAIAVAVTLVCLVSFYGMAVYFDIFLGLFNYTSSSEMFTFDTSGQIVTVILLVCVAAPIGEELIFRGLLVSGMKKSGFHDALCVVLSGLAFSLMHMNPDQTAYQFFLGCACAYLAIKTNSLLPPIIAHAANNGVAVMMELTSFDLFERLIEWMFSNNILMWIIPVIFAGAGSVAVYYLCNLSQKVVIKYHGESDYQPEEPEPIAMPSYNNMLAPNYNMINPFPSYTQVQNNQSPFGQTNQSPYGQNNQSPYGQNNQSPYGQTNQSPYGQNNQSPFGQTNQSPYGQNNQPPYGYQNPNPNGYPYGNQNPNPNGYPYGYQNPNPNGYPYGYQNLNPNGYPYGNPNPNPNGYPNGYQNPNPNGYPNGYPYGSPYMSHPYRPNLLYNKRDPRGKSSFTSYYAISVGVCALIWMFAFAIGILA